jgi:hypothetical protein
MTRAIELRLSKLESATPRLPSDYDHLTLDELRVDLLEGYSEILDRGGLSLIELQEVRNWRQAIVNDTSSFGPVSGRTECRCIAMLRSSTRGRGLSRNRCRANPPWWRRARGMDGEVPQHLLAQILGDVKIQMVAGHDRSFLKR